MKKQSHNVPDIAGLITRLQEQVNVLERKVDTLIERSVPKPTDVKPVPQSFPKPFQQPTASTFAQAVSRQDRQFQVQSGARQDNRFQNTSRQDTRFQNGNRQDNRFRDRVMHKTICADCKKECEVPFRPIEGRPIYCQSCFSQRKASSFKPNFDNRPKDSVLIHPSATQAGSSVAASAKAQGMETKKTIAKKRTVKKQSAVSKKGKKGR